VPPSEHDDARAPRVGWTRSAWVAIVAFLLGGAVGAVLARTTETKGAAFAPPPTPSIVQTQTFQVGQSAKTVLGNTVTFLSWSPAPQIGAKPTKGEEFSRIQVKWCAAANLANPISATEIASAWTLQMADSTAISAQTSPYSDQDLMGLVNTAVDPGQCLKGYVVFETPKGQTPQYAIFSGAQTLRWTVAGG
jgi:hypothetical protein